MDKQLKDIILKNKAIKASEAVKLLGNDMRLTRMVRREEIASVGPQGSGFYTLPEIPLEVALMGVVSRYYPDCIISRYTALAVQELSEDYIHEIHVDVPHYNYSNSAIHFHRVSKKRLIGIENKDFNGVTISIYSKERCLHEALIISKRPTDVFFTCLKNYMRLDEKEKNYKELAKLDKHFKRDVMSYIVAQEAINDSY